MRSAGIICCDNVWLVLFARLSLSQNLCSCIMLVCASFSIATTWNGLPCSCEPLPAQDEQSSHDPHESDGGPAPGDRRFRQTVSATGVSGLAGSDRVTICSDAAEFTLAVSGDRFSALSAERTVFTSVRIHLLC